MSAVAAPPLGAGDRDDLDAGLAEADALPALRSQAPTTAGAIGSMLLESPSRCSRSAP